MIGSLTEKLLKTMIVSLESEEIQEHINSLEETKSEAEALMSFFEEELEARGEEMVEEEEEEEEKEEEKEEV